MRVEEKSGMILGYLSFILGWLVCFITFPLDNFSVALALFPFVIVFSIFSIKDLRNSKQGFGPAIAGILGCCISAFMFAINISEIH